MNQMLRSDPNSIRFKDSGQTFHLLLFECQIVAFWSRWKQRIDSRYRPPRKKGFRHVLCLTLTNLALERFRDSTIIAGNQELQEGVEIRTGIKTILLVEL